MRLISAGPITSRLPRAPVMPLDQHGERTLVWSHAPANVLGSTGTQADSEEVQFDGQPTRKLTIPANTTAVLTVAIDADLSDATDLDLRVYVNDPLRLNSFKLEFASGESGFTDTASQWVNSTLRWAMVRGEQWTRQTWNGHVDTGTPDLAALKRLRITISARADAEGDLVVYLGQLYKVVKPYGVVFMDFDDARISQYEAAFPIMQAHGLRGTLGVITSVVGTSETIGAYDGGWMTWPQIAEMADAGWTIANHTHTHRQLDSLDPAEAMADVETARGILAAQGYEFGSRVLITPYGGFSIALCRDATLPAFSVRWGAAATMPTPAGNPLAHGHRSPQTTDTAQDLIDLIDAAIATRQQFTFAFHSILEDSGSDTYNTPPADFDAVCAHVAAKVGEGTLRCLTREDLYLGGPGPQRLAADRFLAMRGGRALTLDTTPRPA